MICDEFIARIHFIIFRQDCPRISVAAKKMISKVGHWYLEEKNTYIRVFGATVLHIFSPLMSQTIWCWGKYATRPFYRVSMPLW
jgi:hypothetical protein